MIKVLKHNKIDKKSWDDCIHKSFNGNVYALSWYLDIIHPEWDALVENNYERVMPLTNSKKFGLSYMFQPFFAQQLGVYSTSQLSQEDVERFINAIPKQYLLTQYRLNSYNKVDYDSEIIAKHRNVELDLIYDYQYLTSRDTRCNAYARPAECMVCTPCGSLYVFILVAWMCYIVGCISVFYSK